MEKRTLIAIILSILVLLTWSYLAPPPQKPVIKKEAPQAVDKTAAPETPAKVQALNTAPAPSAEIPAEEKEIHVETDFYSAVFTTKGGALKKWDLKDYSYKENNKEKPVALVTSGTAAPLYIMFEGELKDLPSMVTYGVDRDSVTFDADSSALTFYFADSVRGLSIKKTFTFYKNSYRVDLATEVKGVKSYMVALGSEFGIFDKEGTWVHIGPVLLRDADKIDFTAGNLEDIGTIKRWLTGKTSSSSVEHKGNIRWIAEEDKYFAAALVSLNKNNDAVIWDRTGTEQKKGADIAYVVNGEKGDFLLYAGPKKYEPLKTLNAGLEHIVDFGFFSIIAQPLFWLLKVFYKVLGNYGWAIILLTIVVRIPFIPLISKGQKSMKKLQEIQPHMAAVKEKHKKDPQKAQQEIMALYKKHKVNPMGGCLPMLVQIPVFFALYKILLIAIELRGAPFMLWIQDLSAKDPYYIFPIIMGLTMLVQQKMTPSGMDPKQAKIMMIMPIVFTFMFLSFPSGLVIYWLVSNVLGIIQQYYINKQSKLRAES